MRTCDWCRTKVADSSGFCSDECRNSWFVDDRNQEFALEAAMDAIVEPEGEYEPTILDML